MIIRPMTEADRKVVMDMMRVFYASPAVHTNGSDEIFTADIDRCVANDPYLEGYVFEGEEIIGYAMIAKSFSTEFGKPCMWIEDIYIREAYRGQGIGQMFLRFISEKYKDAVIRLEVEEENTYAVHVYKKGGFDVLPYQEMYKI